MSDKAINVGIYGTGSVKHWDVNADKNTVSGNNQKADDALSTAKSHSGAEVVTIDGAGNAGVHSLSVEQGTFFHPPKSGTLTADNLVVSSTRSKNDSKPLAIDPSIAGKLGGQNAILVDEKNQVAYIGNDKNAAAASYLNNPDQKKVAAAYTIAGNDDFVNKKMASNTLNSLSSDFRGNLTRASNDISLLKQGQVKDKMQGLITELGNIDKNAKALDSQIIAPKERLNTANNNWSRANSEETGKINIASENLREAKYPGIHTAEDELGAANNGLQNANGKQVNAEQKVSQAQSKLNSLEQIPSQVSSLKQQQESLKLDNATLLNNFNIALLQRKTDLLWTSADLYSKASSLESDARREESKPYAPSNTGSSNPITSDPFSNSGKISRQEADRIAGQVSGGDGWVSKEDLSKYGYTELSDGPKRDQVAGSDNKITTQEFSDALVSGIIKPKGGSGSGNSVTSDPFSSGNSGNTGSVTDDPFAQANSNTYRDQSKIDRLRRASSGMKADAAELKMRATRIDQLFAAVNITRDLSSSAVISAVQNMDRTYNYGYSDYSTIFGSDFGSSYKGYTYFNADTNDKLSIWNNYIAPTKSNNEAIYSKGQQATQLQNKYYNEHPQAVRDLSNSQDALKGANEGVGYATSQVQQRQAKVDQINSSPLPDTNANVKKTQKSLESAVTHKDSVVGENAPLTKEANAAKKAYDDIVEKIRVNNGGAQSLITNTKNALGI